ncbi:MAG: hypothetical protein A4E49_02622 [Methanosaeta sp. PtaU1.Bin112]|nr:MAG: hypothetical protein A4E49_02622 [Methanosaeta sp. PtaU1.Bin112]
MSKNVTGFLLILSFSIMVLSFSGRAVPPPLEDAPYSIQETAENGFVIAGTTVSDKVAWTNDAKILKINSYGEEEWNKTFGSPDYDSLKSITIVQGNGYIMTGETVSTDLRKLWIAKTDLNGAMLWNKTYGSGWSNGKSIQGTSDGNYIITGYSDKYIRDEDDNHKNWLNTAIDFAHELFADTDLPGTDSYDRSEVYLLLIKVDPNGNVLWEKTFRRSGYDYGFSVHETVDGGYILDGTIKNDKNRNQIWLIKTDFKGDEEWSRIFGGSKGNSIPAASILQTSDGGYVLAGYTESFGEGGSDVWLIKTDKKGDEVWNRTFGGKEDDFGRDIQPAKDGGFLITGTTYSFADKVLNPERWGDIWLIRTNASGNELWNRTFAGVSWDDGYSVREASDGGLILAGSTIANGGEAWIILKTDMQGNEEWRKTY